LPLRYNADATPLVYVWYPIPDAGRFLQAAQKVPQKDEVSRQSGMSGLF